MSIRRYGFVPATSGTFSRRRALQSLGALGTLGTLATRATMGSALASLSLMSGCRKPTVKNGRTVATLWFSYGGKNREVLLDLVRQFNARQSPAQIEATFQGDYFEALAKLRTALAAGVAPTFSHVVGEVVPYLVNAGVIENLDPYDGAREIPFVPALGQLGTYENGPPSLYAVPFNRSVPIMYLNGNMLRRAGVGIPATWDELAEAARLLTQRSSDRVSVWGHEVPISWWFWIALVGQAGGTVVDPSGAPILGGEAGVEALRFWQRLVHADHVMRPPPGRDYNAWQATNQDFLAQRAAIVWTSTAFLRYLEENASFPVVCAPLPGFRKRAVPTGGTFFVMLRSAPSEEKQAAWAFLRWMSEPAQTIQWSTRTGYLPVTTAAIDELKRTGYYEKHANDWVACEQLSAAEKWPWAPNLFRIQREIVEPRLEEAVLTNRDARELLASARERARRRV